MKQRNPCAMKANPSVSCRVKSVVQIEAEVLLASISHTWWMMQKNLDDYNAIVARYTPAFEATRAMLVANLEADEKALQAL